MATAGVLVEDVGTYVCPRWCRRLHSVGGAHRSETFTVGPTEVYMTANADWTDVQVHRAGEGPLTTDDGLYLAAVVQYLSDPAGAGR